MKLHYSPSAKPGTDLALGLRNLRGRVRAEGNRNATPAGSSSGHLFKEAVTCAKCRAII